MGGEAGRSVRERGVIIASGLMAGGALGGVLGAALRLFPWYHESLIKTPFFDFDPVSQIVSAVLFAGALPLRLVWIAGAAAGGLGARRGSISQTIPTLPS